MARRPRERRDTPNGLARLDGFAAGPLTPRREQAQQVALDNTPEAHMRAILASDLTDNMTEEEILRAVEENRVSDNFGPVFDAYMRMVNAQEGDIVDIRPAIGHDAPRNRQQGHAIVPARAPGRAIEARDPRIAMQDMRMEDWCQLRRLPSYILDQIRALGRDIFAMHTDLPLEDINVLGTPFHGREKVRNTIRWITERGTEEDQQVMNFGANVPGYHARTSRWTVNMFSFLIVVDNHGEYVYGWPQAPRPTLENRAEPLRLR